MNGKYGVTVTFIPRLRRFVRRAGEDRITAYAAQSAFYALLALTPFAMLVLSAVGGVLPPEAADLLPPLLSDLLPSLTGSAVSLTPVSAVTALWAVSRGTASVIRGLDSVCRQTENRGFLRFRVAAVLYTLAFLFLAVMALGLLLSERSAGLLPVYSTVWTLLRPFAAIGALTGLFLLMYRYLPTGRPRRSARACLPGAAGAALSWAAFSRLFSVYAAEIADYTRLYGSLAAVAMVMLWLYVCMLLFFLGAEVNEALKADWFL